MVKKTSSRTQNQPSLGYVYNDDYLDDILGDESFGCVAHDNSKSSHRGKKNQDSDQDSYYAVEKILDKKKEGRKTLYLVKWEGYGEDQATWEPTANLSNVKELIKEFEKQQEMIICNNNNQGSTCITNSGGGGQANQPSVVSIGSTNDNIKNSVVQSNNQGQLLPIGNNVFPLNLQSKAIKKQAKMDQKDLILQKNSVQKGVLKAQRGRPRANPSLKQTIQQFPFQQQIVPSQIIQQVPQNTIQISETPQQQDEEQQYLQMIQQQKQMLLQQQQQIQQQELQVLQQIQQKQQIRQQEQQQKQLILQQQLQHQQQLLQQQQIQEKKQQQQQFIQYQQQQQSSQNQYFQASGLDINNQNNQSINGVKKFFQQRGKSASKKENNLQDSIMKNQRNMEQDKNNQNDQLTITNTIDPISQSTLSQIKRSAGGGNRKRGGKRILVNQQQKQLEQNTPYREIILQEGNQDIIVENQQEKELPAQGTFEYDIAERVSAAKMSQGMIHVTIEWKTRQNGFKPQDTIFTNEEVKQRCPKLLVDFYESRINARSHSNSSSTAQNNRTQNSEGQQQNPGNNNLSNAQ